jgi:predicted ATP-binding protein involved in virulence
MRLTKLRLQNYRVHTDSTLDIGDATYVVIRGGNDSGKTSFADALSMNLASTAVSLPGDGKGFVKKITQGEGKSVITADIQGQHHLRNTVTLNVNTSGRTPFTECVDEPDNTKVVNAFKNILTDRRDALLISLNTDYFMKMEEAKQTNLLAKLVLPSRYEFPADKTKATNDLLDKPINFDDDPFTVITSAYKALYKERETVNRQVKEFKVPDPMPPVKGKDGKPVDSDSLNSELVSIREQREKIQKERDEAVEKANAIEVRRATLNTTRENLLKKRDDDKKKLEIVEFHIISEEVVAKLKETVSKADELAKLNSDHAGCVSSISIINSQIDKFKGLVGEESACPTCEQVIDKEKVDALIIELQSELDKADQWIKRIDKQIEAIGDVDAAKEKLKNHEAAVKEKEEIEKSLRETVEEGKKTRAELDSLGEPVNATLSFNDPVAELQLKEDKINEQLRPVIAAEERNKEIKRLTEQLTNLQKKASTLDSLVKYFDKDGIKAELISQHIGGFEAKINPVMEVFGYKASLSFDPSIGFDVTTARGYKGPIKELCGAQVEIFKRAFQCAVAIASGVKLVVIDEMEELGENLRPMLFKKVFELVNGGLLDQAIMIGFSLDKTLPERRVPNSAYFFVEDGTVEKLG